MGPRIPSKLLQIKIDSEKKERSLQAAELQVIEEWAKPASNRLSVRSIALAHGVAPSTLAARIHGRKSNAEFAKERRLLGEQEEIVLADYVRESAERAFPLTYPLIRDCAALILRIRDPEGDVGQQWVYRWMLTHPDLQVYTSGPLDQARINGMNPQAMEIYWRALYKVYYELRPIDDPIGSPVIWAMDETGVMVGFGGKQKVVGAAGKNIQHKGRDGNRELVTVMVTICADGSRLKEMIIFKGKRFQQRWAEANRNNLR